MTRTRRDDRACPARVGADDMVGAQQVDVGQNVGCRLGRARGPGGNEFCPLQRSVEEARDTWMSPALRHAAPAPTAPGSNSLIPCRSPSLLRDGQDFTRAIMVEAVA